MANHQAAEVLAAVTPSIRDVAVASVVILKALAEGHLPRSMLYPLVEQALMAEPLPGVSTTLEGVAESEIRRVRAQAAMHTALAHMQARGTVLPIGGVSSAPTNWEIKYQTPRYSSGYRVADGPFNYQLADAYGLPRFAMLAPTIETPAMFLDNLPAAMGPKVRRVLVEAVEAYRAGLFFASALLLGVASEAAWHQLAGAVVARTGDKRLADLLADEVPSIARIQQRVVEVVRPLKLIPETELNTIDATEQAYRDIRNYAVHEADATFDEVRFAQSRVGTLLEGSIGYFRRLYHLDGELRASATAAPTGRPAP